LHAVCFAARHDNKERKNPSVFHDTGLAKAHFSNPHMGFERPKALSLATARIHFSIRKAINLN